MLICLLVLFVTDHWVKFNPHDTVSVGSSNDDDNDASEFDDSDYDTVKKNRGIFTKPPPPTPQQRPLIVLTGDYEMDSDDEYNDYISDKYPKIINENKTDDAQTVISGVSEIDDFQLAITSESEMDESEVDESEMDESEMDESEMDESEIDETEMDDVQTVDSQSEDFESRLDEFKYYH